MNRIKQLCSYLDNCGSFADVGCDHGYCTKYMLDNDLCKSAIISDVSEKCLQKAQTLLSDYIKSGKCRSVCCSGLELIDDVDEALIAGMGGEEIVGILKNSFIPRAFVFQPMKNADVLREYLISENCVLDKDDIFTDGKNYYFIIKGKKSGARRDYNAEELRYGKDSLKNPVFYEYLREELLKKKNYLSRDMSAKSRIAVEADIVFMEMIINGKA